MSDNSRRATVLAILASGIVLLVLWTAVGLDARHPIQVATTADHHVAPREEGHTWHVMDFRPDARIEIRVPVDHRGWLPIDVEGLSHRLDDPPQGHCGWWPQLMVIDGTPLVGDRPEVRISHDSTVEMVVSGDLLGEPGCLREGVLGRQDHLEVDVRVLGAPRSIGIALPDAVAWSTEPREAAERLTGRSTAPRVGTAP